MTDLLTGFLTAAAVSLLPLAAGLADRWDTRRRQPAATPHAAFVDDLARLAIRRGQGEEAALETQLIAATALNQRLKGGAR